MLDASNSEFLEDVLTAVRTLEALTGAPPDPYLSNEIAIVREVLASLEHGGPCDRTEALEVVALMDTIIAKYPALEGEIAYSSRADHVKMTVTAHLSVS